MPGETLQAAVDRALEAHARLIELGETIDDEWSYVNDLSDAWRTRLMAVADDRGDEPVADAVSLAIDRAIDWLSTYPQVVLIALRATP